MLTKNYITNELLKDMRDTLPSMGGWCNRNLQYLEEELNKHEDSFEEALEEVRLELNQIKKVDPELRSYLSRL